MKNQDTQAEFEEPPGHRRPPHPWEDVFPTPEEVASLSPSGPFCVETTSFAKLMASDDPSCPVRRQTVPIAHDLVPFEVKLTVSLAKDAYFSVLGLVHCHPDIVGNRHAQFNTADYKEIPAPMILNTEGKQ